MTEITLVAEPRRDSCDRAKEVLHHLPAGFELTVTEIAFSSDEGRKLTIEHAILTAPACSSTMRCSPTTKWTKTGSARPWHRSGPSEMEYLLYLLPNGGARPVAGLQVPVRRIPALRPDIPEGALCS